MQRTLTGIFSNTGGRNPKSKYAHVPESNIGDKKQNTSSGPGWIQDRSKGIMMLLIGIGIASVFWQLLYNDSREMNLLWIIPVLFGAKGISLLMRSHMRRKYETQEPTEQQDPQQN